MKILRPYEPPFEYLNELVESLVTEDDEPVDQFTSANRDLLISVLYTSWVPPVEPAIGRPRQFFACGNVGVFPCVRQPPLVPDLLLSMDVKVEGSLHDKRNAAYFLWEFGKPPDVVVEIVDDEKGEELNLIMGAYERIRVTYYVVYDPRQLLSNERLQVFELRGGEVLSAR
ncbi:MAG: Uma2 family endonuclease [Blastocatellia bacterium]